MVYNPTPCKVVLLGDSEEGPSRPCSLPYLQHARLLPCFQCSAPLPSTPCQPSAQCRRLSPWRRCGGLYRPNHFPFFFPRAFACCCPSVTGRHPSTAPGKQPCHSLPRFTHSIQLPGSSPSLPRASTKTNTEKDKTNLRGGVRCAQAHARTHTHGRNEGDTPACLSKRGVDKATEIRWTDGAIGSSGQGLEAGGCLL